MGAGAPSSGKGTRIDLVPILDALVVVIFFLVLSISFTELTKVTMPPTQVADAPTPPTANQPPPEPPLQPHLLASFRSDRIQLIIQWKEKQKAEFLQDSMKRMKGHSPDLESLVTRLTEKFKKNHPTEKTLQISATKEATFQEFITLVDGAKKNFEDVVMNSYQEAERKFQ